MKWALLVAGSLCVLIVLIAAIGAMLPVKHHATRKAHFQYPAETVYGIISGPADWRSDVKATGPLPDQNGRKQWWEQDSRGHRVTFELVEEAPPTRRVIRIVSENLPFGGVWTYEIVPSGRGSDVRIQENGEIYNVGLRFFARFVLGYAGTIESTLRDLGVKLNDPARIEA